MNFIPPTMLRTYLWPFSLLLLTLFSCEKVVDFQPTAYQPKLVIHGSLFADSIPGVLVGQTQTYYGWEEYIASQLYVEGAEVSLTGPDGREEWALGRYATDMFNLWAGIPSGYRSREYEPADPSPDSSLRLYEGLQPLQGGEWYTFRARYGDDSVRREIYVPHRVQNVEATFRTRDTSYTFIAPWDDAEAEVDQTVFEIVVSYDLIDTEPLWTKPLVRQPFEAVGYNEYDPNTGQVTFYDDTVELNRFANASFTPTEGPQRMQQVVRLGSSGTWTYVLPDGGTRADQRTQFVYSDADQERIYQGDTIETRVMVQVLLSHAREEVTELLNALFEQRFASQDPLAEPIITSTGEDGSVGIITGFSTTEEIEVPVRYWLRQ